VKIISIAANTFKEVVREPVFYILVIVACLMVVVARLMPLFTINEDIKMMKDIGLSTVKVTGLLIALLAASRVVSGEIEARTAITVVAKPVRRSQFILGKYLGIVGAVLLGVFVITLVFMAMVWWQVLDQFLTPEQQVQKQVQGVINVGQGCLLSFFEVMLLTAVSVAVSVYATMVVNVGVCFGFFLLGNLSGWFLVETLPQAGPGLAFVGKAVLGALPFLETYNVQALALGTSIPYSYLLLGFGYAVYYSAAALLVAVALFHRREL
jgi:ABC-type transport system involved in multi-copper enzyme maturation permease subunit